MKPRVVVVALVLLLSGILLFTYGRSRISAHSSAHSATLKWVPVAGATSYNVYRGTVRGGPYRRIGIALNPTYVDTPLPSRAVFYYVVTSVRYQRESRYSQEVKASIP